MTGGEFVYFLTTRSFGSRSKGQGVRGASPLIVTDVMDLPPMTRLPSSFTTSPRLTISIPGPTLSSLNLPLHRSVTTIQRENTILTHFQPRILAYGQRRQEAALAHPHSRWHHAAGPEGRRDVHLCCLKENGNSYDHNH